MKIHLTRNKPEGAKLALVKAVKDLTGLGLKDSKDIVDESCKTTPATLTLDIGDNSVFKKDKTYYEAIISFNKYLNENCTGDYTIFGTDIDREGKILELGIGEKSDYINFISRHYMMFKNREELGEYIRSLLHKFEMDDILKMFNETRNELKEK